jgi:hypothetical protein
MRSISGLALLLALAGCVGAGGWNKPGVRPEKAAQDYADCRHTAELAQIRDSNIDADILATRGQDWERLGVLSTKRNDFADSNSARSGDLVQRCMLAKGYGRSS